MAMNFEYDSQGTAFLYFVLSVLGIVHIPFSFFLWRAFTHKDTSKRTLFSCTCEPCLEKKRLSQKNAPLRTAGNMFCRALMVAIWCVLIASTIRVSGVKEDIKEYDPYSVLELDSGASSEEIKKQYRHLSRKFHPDKMEGDETKFIELKRAHDALTNEEAKKNWDLYGNPDGPGSTTFGIALPSWMVDKKNSVWVLGAYVLAFMVILPICVGTWWYRSIMYSAESVLLDTEQLFYYFFYKTPSMNTKRLIMVLTASLEFEKGHNSEIQERPSDNVEIPMLLRMLGTVGEKGKERPFCYPYAVKARSLLLAHLERIPLNPATLGSDLRRILINFPLLSKEAVSIINALISYWHGTNTAREPKLETLENAIRLCAQVVQAVPYGKSPLLQLPNISTDLLHHFNNKKRHIRSVKELMAMPEEQRRQMLWKLSDEQYQGMMSVCKSMPRLEVTISLRVVDDDDSHIITAGSIVTATVLLVRHNLGDTEDKKEDDSDEGMEADERQPEAPKIKQSQKTTRKGGRNSKGSKNATSKNSAVKGKPAGSQGVTDPDGHPARSAVSVPDDQDDKRHSGNSSDDEQSDDSSTLNNTQPDDDLKWKQLQDDLRRTEQAQTRSSSSSPLVHCPYMPLDKHEAWWVYVFAKKSLSLVTPAQRVVGLCDREEVQLRFVVPEKIGSYQYTCCVRSDSYLDLDTVQNFKVDVAEAREVDPGAQWDFESDDDKDEDYVETDGEPESADQASDSEDD